MTNSNVNKVNIIEAGLEELDLVAQLFDQYRVFYKQPSNIEAASSYIRERMEKEESIIFLALEKEDTHVKIPLGFVQLYPTFSSVSMKRLWILNDLFVAPHERKRGVGRDLMNKAKEHAQGPNVQGLTLQTAVDNYTAQGLYESLGYQRENKFYRYNLRF